MTFARLHPGSVHGPVNYNPYVVLHLSIPLEVTIRIDISFFSAYFTLTWLDWCIFLILLRPDCPGLS